MSIAQIPAIFVALVALSQAHWAGAGYLLAIQQGRRPMWAILRTIASISLAGAALWMMPPP